MLLRHIPTWTPATPQATLGLCSRPVVTWPYGPPHSNGEGYGAFEGDVPWERKTNETGLAGALDGDVCIPGFVVDIWPSGMTRHACERARGQRERVARTREREREASPVGEPESMPLSRVNPAWMNVAFTGRPAGCDQDRGTRDEMRRLWAFREMQARHGEGRYKFILDVRMEFRVRHFD